VPLTDPAGSAMIRALAHGHGGRPVMILGLTAENVRRLQAGQPIMAKGNEHGMDFPGDVMILHGETGDDIIKSFRDAGVQLPEVKMPPPGDPK